MTTGMEEREPAALAWVGALVETGAGRARLAVQSVEAVQGGAEVIAGLHYPDTDGQIRPGQAKVYLPDALQQEPSARLPLIHVAGYELDRGSAEAAMAAGVILSTPYGEEPNPMVRGENLDVAILHRVRTLPCVDDAKVLVVGGSAGGYMTLMLTAETFPLAGAQPDCPPLNLGYNCGYIVANKHLAEARSAGQEHPDLPVVAMVVPIGEGARDAYGTDHSSETWLNASPLGRMDAITCPVVMTISTADLLVPIDQYGAALVRPFDPFAFPDGFTMEMDRLMARPEARRTLLETVGPEDLEVTTVPVPDGAPRFGWDLQPLGPAVPPVSVPFSRTKRFSLMVLDEGAPEPQVGHLKYAVGLNKDAFRAWALSRPMGPEQLTPAKLRMLMLRALGGEPYPQRVTRDGHEVVMNRRDFPEVERADVVRGLCTFAAAPACAARLHELYRALPGDLQALGDPEAMARSLCG